MPDLMSFDDFLKGGQPQPQQQAMHPLLSFEEFSQQKPVIRTQEQAAAKVAEDAGVKADESKGQQSSDEGFWSLAGRSFLQSAIQSGQETAAGAAASVPSALGGSTVAQQAETLPEPDAQDEITRLNRQPITDPNAFTNPRWWGVKVGGYLGGAAPIAALGGAGALAGGAVAGPVGAVAGGAAGAGGAMGFQTLVPSYKAARMRGLDHDAALNEALTQTGIAGSFGAAMGIVGGTPLFGTTINGVLKRPLTEALVKLGVAEPGLMVGQMQAQKAAGPGGWLTPDEALEGYIMGAGVGAALHGAGAAIRPFSDKVAERFQGSLTPEGLLRGYTVTQEPEPDLPNIMSHSPMWPKGEEFFDKISEAISKHPEAQLTPDEWHEVMNGAHKSSENVELPAFLADNNGKVSKDKLLAYVEARGVWTRTDTDPGGRIITAIHEPSGKTTPFARVIYRITEDRDGYKTLAVTDASLNMDRLRNMKADPMDVVSHVIAERAVGAHADKIAYSNHLVNSLGEALGRLSEMHGMSHGMTRVEGWQQDTPYVFISPVNASNVRQGANLFSRGPGTYVNEDPFGPGRKAITDFLDRNARAQMPRSEWVKTPEGGNGLYMRIRREAGDRRLVDLANLDFEKRGTGAFGHYLDHIEREASKHGLSGVRVENIMNKRLPGFLERRGYTREVDPFNPLDMPSMRKENLEPPEQMAAGTGAKRIFPTAGTALLTPDQLKPAARQVAKIIESLRKAMGMKVPITIDIHNTSGKGTLGDAGRTATGFHINLYLGEHEKTGAEGLFSTAAHEFGHVVMWHFFDRSPMEIKNRITDAFDRWKANAPPNQSMNQLGLRRNNAIDLHYGGHWYDPDFPVLSLTPERQRYWAGFEEWFAEQTARWATTSAKPLGQVDRFFHSLGNRVRSVIQQFKTYLGKESKGKATPEEMERMSVMAEPEKEMKEWLDSLVNTVEPFAADVIAAAQLRSIRSNQSAINRAGESFAAVPETLSTGSARGLISRIFGRNGPNPEIAASADRFNKFYEWMVSLPQLAKLNPHIDGLQRYRELVSMLHLEKVQMMNEAETTLHLWRALQLKQMDSVAGLIDDYMNMEYRTPDEVKNKVSRRPSQDEFKKLATEHGVTDKGMAVFQRVVKDFDRMLDRYRMLLEQGAHEIEDPIASAKALQDIAQQIETMKKAPYFPAMRFGKYTLTVKDKSGAVVHFETFENQGRRDRALAEAQGEFPADHFIRAGTMEKDVAPLVGLPPGLLDTIGAKLDLSRTQRDALDQLRYEYMPAQSFAHRFRRKDNISGYSTDFLRAYASYMFHGSNYFTRVKYVQALRDVIKATADESKQLEQATKRDQITNFMREHLDYLLNPKADFATLRSMMFHWALGFSPAAATLNLSQTALGTYPYLASKFGSDIKAIAAMANASRRVSTFYSKLNLSESTEPQLKGIAEAVREGLISETQANTLAATADGRVLTQAFGGNKAEKAFNLFSRASQFFFEMTEQTNRRVAFRAAWDMAMADPGNRHVNAMVRSNQILFDSLRLKGFTEQEAKAYVTAKDAVESTQYVYAPYARPKFMQGGIKSTLFIFHSFTQNTLAYLWTNPGSAMRSLILLGAAGGLMGLPGMEDANGTLRALAYHLFGKDFDLQDEVRKFVVDVLHGGGQVDRPGAVAGDQGIRPDILLHGMSRVGYGIPAVMDQLGSIAGMGHIPMPTFDRHSNLSMGNILPVEPGPLLAPQITGPGAGVQNLDSAALRQGQRASGAAFGLGFALYRALEATQDPKDFRRWEGAMPTALRNASQAFRYYQEGKARNAQGAAVARFDPNEPEQAMEIIGQSLGYRPERLSAAWDLRTAEVEATAFWEVRKSYLMQAAWSAKQSSDSDTYKRSLEAIRKFNRDLPQDARGLAITSDALRASFTSRAKQTVATETGVPRQRGQVPLARSIQRLYPEAQPAGRKIPPQGGALGR